MGDFTCSSLVLYGIRAPIIGPCMEANYPYGIKNPNGGRGLWMPELALNGIRLLAPASIGKLSTDESGPQFVVQ